MAISVAWQTTATITAAGTTALYTVPSSGNFGTYARDIVVTNGGTANCFVGLGSLTTSASTAASVCIPAGGTMILTQCAVPTTSAIYGVSNVSCPVSIGFATNVMYI